MQQQAGATRGQEGSTTRGRRETMGQSAGTTRRQEGVVVRLIDSVIFGGGCTICFVEGFANKREHCMYDPVYDREHCMYDPVYDLHCKNMTKTTLNITFLGEGV